MIINIKHPQPIVKFNPIEISFTVESKRELELLEILFNASGNDIAEFLNNAGNRFKQFEGTEVATVFDGSSWKEIRRLNDTI